MVAARELAPAGDLRQQAVLPFEFKSVEMEHDSYKGLQVRLRCASLGHSLNLARCKTGLS